MSTEIHDLSPEEQERAEKAAAKQAIETEIKKAQDKIRAIHNGEWNHKMKSGTERREAVKTMEFQIEKAKQKLAQF